MSTIPSFASYNVGDLDVEPLVKIVLERHPHLEVTCVRAFVRDLLSALVQSIGASVAVSPSALRMPAARVAEVKTIPCAMGAIASAKGMVGSTQWR